MMMSAVAGRTIGMSAVMGSAMAMAAGVAVLVVGLAAAQIVAARSSQGATVAAPQVTMLAEVTPNPVETLDRVTIQTTFQASADVPEALRAHLEVRDAAGKSVLSTTQSGFRIPAQGARAVYWDWRVPGSLAPGEYSLDVKLTGVDSGKLYGEEARAAVFTVQAR